MHHSATSAGSVLLLIATHDAETAEALTKHAGIGSAEAAEHVQRLMEFGFIVIAGEESSGLGLYRINPKGVRTEATGAHQRILVVEDTEAVRDLVCVILEEAGYAVIATIVPANAATLLQEVDFDLVIADSYSSIPSGTFASTAAVLAAAGNTPVALFTAHRIELSQAQAAGFRTVITKPFDLDALLEQVAALLGG
jgi:CheY-like chemotaxis protein